jgi:hypothetical protein
MRRTRKLAAVVIAATGVALFAAACGGSSRRHHTAATPQTEALAFARCIRSHGVPSFADPGAGGASNVNPQSPAFQTALHACRRLNPKASPPPTHSSALQRQAAVRFAQCMRTRGYPTFPDPVATLPGAGNGTVLGADHLYFVLAPQTGIAAHSAAFIRTASACGVNPLG